MENKSTTVEPFEDIAVALSGGGFRAAGFALGCLSYLQRVTYMGSPLLQHVKFISSASGGSITNLFYASKLTRGNSFASIYQALFNLLEGDKLIASVFEKLLDDAAWKSRPLKGRNLINAFALAYDAEGFFNKDTFETINTQQTHIEEICVNATDFENGITFRFQNTGLIGNKYLHFKKTAEALSVAGKIKLADILAASSCFPSGFEPLIFPDDFLYNDTRALQREEIEKAFQIQPSETYIDDKEAEKNPAGSDLQDRNFGLMDGGITDNQGINSFLLANDRKEKRDKKQKKTKSGYDLFIMCDVASHYMESYTLIKEDRKSWWGKITIQQWINIFKFSWIGLLIGIISFFLHFNAAGYIISTVSVILLVIYLFFSGIYNKKKTLSREAGNTWGIILFKYINNILGVRTSAIVQMMSSRVKSVGILAGDVYLKQIRRLTYETLFHDKKWQTHAAPVLIYELSARNKNNHNRQLADFAGFRDASGNDLASLMETSPAMESCATTAHAMDTTLWFDENHKKDKVKESIIATGQFTTCFTLIKYLCRLEKSGVWNEGLSALKENLLQDWLYFKETDCRFLDSPEKFMAPQKPWKP